MTEPLAPARFAEDERIRIGGGYNDQAITIAAEPGHTPQVGWIEIGDGQRWRLRGLTVSPSLAPSPLERTPHDLAMLGDHPQLSRHAGPADRSA